MGIDVGLKSRYVYWKKMQIQIKFSSETKRAASINWPVKKKELEPKVLPPAKY
jgi:hypothetical protein